MDLPRLFLRRKYPVQRDTEGRSLRQRCFERFEEGQPPAEVAAELDMKEATVSRYFGDWQRQGPPFDKQYAFVKDLLKKAAPERGQNIKLFAMLLGISVGQLETILSRPHGLKQLITGKLYFPVQEEADHKRRVALELAVLIADHLVKNGGQFEDVCVALRRYIRQNRQYRRADDAEIEEKNKVMLLIHKILAVEIENERQGRVKPDTLSEQERDAVIRLETEKILKETEAGYWARVTRLEGLTREQAHEKITQDLQAKIDVKGNRIMREFLDRVRPVNKEGQRPSPSSPLAPSPP